jgi:hypothetical protein
VDARAAATAVAAAYVQIQRAIVAKEQELKEIYEIQRSASTLTALIDSHERQRAQLESDLSATKERLQHEIELTRAHWEQEKKQRDAEARERDAAEAKRREREKEEYRYAFAREQQQAKDQFADETARAGKELAERKAQAEKELAERERAVKAREEEAAGLRQRVEIFPKELEAAVARAVKETTTRLQQESLSREEIFKREFAGEKNVFATRIASLEQTVKEQTDQLPSSCSRRKRPTVRCRRSPSAPSKARAAPSNWRIYNNCWPTRCGRVRGRDSTPARKTFMQVRPAEHCVVDGKAFGTNLHGPGALEHDGVPPPGAGHHCHDSGQRSDRPIVSAAEEAGTPRLLRSGRCERGYLARARSRMRRNNIVREVSLIG